ncbi:MAG: AAA family ATPase [Clostridium sp.]
MSNIHFVDAIYNDSPIIDYDGNPLIEAIPPIYSRDEVVQLLSVYPYFNDNERNERDEYRFHYILRLLDYFQPLNRHIALERKFSTIMRQGYINRNPLSKNTVEYMNHSYQMLMQGKLPKRNNINKEKKVQGFSIIGISGAGKSTTIDRILSVYPTLIKHNSYKGEIINVYQMPWVKLQCPPDGSLGGLCLKFFGELDERLRFTEYRKRYRRFRIDDMIVEMAHLCRLYNIGVLVIDEIQHLSLQATGGIKKMLNFFVDLVNSIGVPVILIGTNKSFDLLNKEFRQALRSTGNGSPKDDWDKLKNDKNWEILMNGLLSYQWTRNPVKDIKELELLSKTLYEQTQGVLGIAVKLFVVAQMEAILNKREKVTEDLLERTFRKHFSSLTPMINALRNGNRKEINEYEDLKIDIEEIIGDLENDLLTKDFIEENKQENKEIRKALQQKLSLRLTEKITDSKIIQASIKKVLDKYNYTNYNFESLYEKALKIAEEKLLNKKIRSNMKQAGLYLENDLRVCRKEALEGRKSTYEILKEKEIVMDPYEYLGLKGGV